MTDVENTGNCGKYFIHLKQIYLGVALASGLHSTDCRRGMVMVMC